MDLEVFGLPGDRLRAMLESFGRVEAVGESFQVFKLGDIDVSLPRRDSKAGRGHRGFVVTGDPAMSIAEAARRRDFTVNAISWDPLTDEYLDPFDGRADLERRAAARRRSADVRRRQPARAARASSSRRASSSTLDRRRARALPRDSARRSAGGARLGRVRKAAVRAAAVGRLRARDGSRRDREALSRAAGARRLPAGAGVASRGRRLGAHAAGHRSGAHAHRRSAAAAAARGHARRGLPRSRQAGDDGVHRRPHPIDRSRRAGRGAGAARFSIG